MITLKDREDNFPNGMFELNSSQDGRFGWFLLTWHPEEDPILEEIQIQIKIDLRNSALGQTSKVEIESWLKDFFSEYHWKMHAAFRKTNLKEKGISLFLAVMYDNELYIMEFGRMLSGLVEKDTLKPVGRSWNNFHVKSLDEMQLLGLSENDISVKPKRIILPENQYLIALPSVFADQLMQMNFDYASINTLLISMFEESNGCYLLLESKSKLSIVKRSRIKPFQISAFIIIILTLLALLYMQFGNRWFESTGRKMKILLTSKSSLTMEQIPQYLNIESETLKRQLEKIERFANLPARQIRLNQIWQTDLNFLITANPAFDTKNIYIASDNNLMAFNKNTKKLEWKQDFAVNVKGIKIIRNNLIVFLDNQMMVCLRNGDNISWSKPTDDRILVRQAFAPLELSNDEDPRINGSILLVPSEKGIYIHDVNSGDKITEILFDKKLQFLSEYDAYDNCFYAVVADGVHCISLDILN
ncbi:MAG: hypothetical protein R6V77_03780 [Candidatus Cloacimonadaceae bacterium]